MLINTSLLRLERLPEVCARVGVKKSTIYRWISLNKFPAPSRIGDNSVAWDSRQIDRWIIEHLEGANHVNV